MVVLRLEISGAEIDLTDAKIVYIKQNANLGDITTINTSFTWSVKVPKTPENTKIFDSLGIVGDTSRLPYNKNYVDLIDNGMPIIKKGILLVKETSTEYKVNIQDGVIDFIKDIGIDKIGETIDLTELDHENNFSTIIASFTNLTYRYLIANYNGPPLSNTSGKTNLATTGLVASINVEYLWNKIFDYYGWTYEGLDFNLSNLWMTYPNATNFGAEDLVAEAYVDDKFYNTGTNNSDVAIYRKYITYDTYATNPTYAEVVAGSNQSTFRILETGYYEIEWRNLGTFYSTNGFASTVNGRFYSQLYVNGVFVDGGNPDGSLQDPTDDDWTYQNEFQAGDTVQILLIGNLIFGSNEVTLTTGRIKIKTLGVQDIIFSQALIKLKTIDFIKEIMLRNSLTAFVDVQNKNIEFLSMKERNKAQVVDWSSKYVDRKSETYLFKSYAQNNFLKHKYNESGNDFNDGNIVVPNENLGVDKNLYNSFSYSPDEDLVEFNGQLPALYYVNTFRMFDVEVKEDADTGDLIANYKPLKDRFYFMNSVDTSNQIYINGNLILNFPLGVSGNNVFKNIVNAKYSGFRRLVLEDARVHKIELALSKYDVAGLDMRVRYYFEQESGVYILNNIKWENGKTCIGEFVRVKNNFLNI